MRNYIVLFLGCLLLHVAGTWSLPLIDRDEPRFAEASREMLERGDYIVPYFNNQFRFDKPPLTYWFQIASYRIFGENDFAARFPTAVAAALVALVLLAWGKRVRDVHAGSRQALQRYFTLEPVLDDEEGRPVTLERNVDVARVKIVGSVTGSAAIRGVLRHRGWEATRVALPPLPSPTLLTNPLWSPGSQLPYIVHVSSQKRSMEEI